MLVEIAITPLVQNARIGVLKFLVLVLLLFCSHQASAFSPFAESAFLEQDSTLSDALALEDSAYIEHQAILLNPKQGLASAWIRLPLPDDRRTYRLAMPFSLRARMTIYAHRLDGSVSEYDLGAQGADTQYQTSAIGHQIQLDPSLLDFNVPLYIKADTSLFLNQNFDLLPEAEFISSNSRITILHKIMTASCLVATLVYAALLWRYPSALVGATLTLLIGLLFFTFSSIALNLITSINFRSPALHNIALFDMPLMFCLIAMCLRQLGLLKLIAPRLNIVMLCMQTISLAAAVSTFFFAQDTADNIAFTSVVINLVVSCSCVIALFLKHRQHKSARLAIMTFGVPSLGTLIYMGPTYFNLAAPTSGSMTLPVSIIIMIVLLLRLVPKIASGELDKERESLLLTLQPQRPYIPLATHYTTVVLSFGVLLIVSATVVQSAFNSRGVESAYKTTSSRAFGLIESELIAALRGSSAATPMHEEIIADGSVSQIQLSAQGRDGPVVFSKGAQNIPRAHYSYFPIEHKDASGMARLAIDITEATTNENLVNNNQLLGNLSLALALSLFTLAVFRSSVTKHLESTANYLANIDLEKPHQGMPLTHRGALHTNEFDSVNDAINTMETDLRAAYKNLWNANAVLELEVSKRTAAHKEVLEREHRKRELVTMGLMVASVAHELRNPLGTLASTVLLIRNTIGESHPQMVERMERSVKRCNQVVEELRVLGRQSALKPLETNIQSWLTKVLCDYEKQHGFSLEKNLQSDFSALIDKSRLERAIIILLDNARQSIQKNNANWPDDGQIQVFTRASGNSFTLRVQDNGSGLPQDHEHKIFEPLFTSKSSGFGMGLSIALNIVEQHEGTLNISNYEDGVSAVISLPTRPNVSIE